MNTVRVTSNNFPSIKSLFGSAVGKSYVWNNLIIEKRISMNWAYKLFKHSILYDFWSVLFSPVK